MLHIKNNIYSVTDIHPQKTKYTEVLRILEKMLLLVKEGYWDNTSYSIGNTELDSIKTTNYYGSQLYRNNLALWEVEWVQNIKLGIDKFNLNLTKEIKSGNISRVR